jgi:hypothetical protein
LQLTCGADGVFLMNSGVAGREFREKRTRYEKGLRRTVERKIEAVR